MKDTCEVSTEARTATSKLPLPVDVPSSISQVKESTKTIGYTKRIISN